MPVKACVFGKQQSAHEQRRNVAQSDEVGGRERDVDGAVRPGAVFGSEDEIAAQARDRRRHLMWWPEVDLLAHRERGRVRQASAYTHVDRGRAKVTAGAGRRSQAFGNPEPGCAHQVRGAQMLPLCRGLPRGSTALGFEGPACGSASVRWRSSPKMPAMSQAVAGDLTLTPAGPARVAARTASRKRPGHVATIMSACSRTP